MNKSAHLLDTVEALLTEKSIFDYDASKHSDLEKSLEEHHKESIDSHGKSHLNESRRYTLNASSYNNQLRGLKPHPNINDTHPASKASINRLKNYTRKPTNENFTVYRGITNKKPHEFKTGQMIHDKGFTSTSLDPAYGVEFSTNTGGSGDNNPEGGTVFRIKVHKGVRGHYVPSDKQTPLKDQKEFILHPGTKFKVVGKSINKNYLSKWGKARTNQHFVDLEVHHQED